jgi:hypothetical protein
VVGVAGAHGRRLLLGGCQWQLRLYFLPRRGGGGEVGLDVDVGGVGEREALVDGVGEGGSEDRDGPGRDEGPHDAAADDLALPGGEQHGEPRRLGRRRGREHGPGHGEELEPTAERHGGAAHGDVPDGARRAQDADAAAPAARVLGDARGHVGPRRHLEDVRVERVGAVARDDHRRLGLVLGPQRPAPRPPQRHDGPRRARLLLLLLLALRRGTGCRGHGRGSRRRGQRRHGHRLVLVLVLRRREVQCRLLPPLAAGHARTLPQNPNPPLALYSAPTAPRLPAFLPPSPSWI